MSVDSYGATPYFNAALNATKEVVAINTVRVCFMQIINNSTSDVFLQMFDALTANVTVGSTTPNLSLLIPAGSGSNAGGIIETLPIPIRFNTGLVIAATTSATGSGNPTAITVNFTLL